MAVAPIPLRRAFVLLAMILFGVGGFSAPGVAPPATGTEPVAPVKIPAISEEWLAPDRVVVGLKDKDSSTLAEIRRAATARGGSLAWTQDVLGFAVVESRSSERDALMQDLARVPGVAYVVPDMLVRGAFVPGDPSYASQWGPPAIGMEAAWDVSLGSHGRTVAVLDSGVRYTHSDLAANVCALGPDFVNGDLDPDDDHGHGTHVAGTVAAKIDNSVGVAGMADVCVVPVKVLNAANLGGVADFASGVVWAAENGANVISMSLGGFSGDPFIPPMRQAVEYAWSKGALIVAAAMNGGCSDVGYPAAYVQVVAVGSLDDPGTTRSSFSNCGPEVEITAPGADILSTVPDCCATFPDPSGYSSWSGTSMATPHVSGVAALVWDQDATMTNRDVRCILQETADDLGASGADDEYGIGRVDADAAILLPAVSPTCDGLWPPMPANDLQAGAIAIPALPYANVQATQGARLEPLEPTLCPFMAATVWYSYTHPAASLPSFVTVDTFGSTYDTVLAVHEALGGEIGCNDDADPGTIVQSQVTFTAVPGRTYLFQVGGWEADWGTLDLNVA